MVYGVEAFDYEARSEVVLRGRATGLHREGVGRWPWRGASARNTKLPVNEVTHMRRWKGRLFLRRRSGRSNGRRSAPCL